MEEYEYLVLDTHCPLHTHDLKVLASYGAKGWECFYILIDASFGSPQYHCFLRRPLAVRQAASVS